MSDTTAKIRSKGLDATGVTEDIADELYAHKGRHYMAIVELKVDETHENAEGKRKVDLVLAQVEPAMDEQLAEHLRELQRTVYLNRQHVGAQLAIDQELTGDEPTVEGVVAAGAPMRPHPFLPVDATQDNPICDVCGLVETAPRHSAQDTLPEHDDEQPDEQPDEPALNTEGDDEDPWEYPDPEGGREPSTIASPFDTDPAA